MISTIGKLEWIVIWNLLIMMYGILACMVIWFLWKNVDDRFVEKTHEDFDEKDNISISKNAKAKNYLIYGLDRNIYLYTHTHTHTHIYIYIIVLIKHLVHMKCGAC